MLKSLSRVPPDQALGAQLAVIIGSLHFGLRARMPAALLLGAGLSAVLMFITYRVKSFMEAIPTSRVRSVAMGLAELKGEAVKWGEEFKAPYSGKTCLAYEIKEERHQRTGKSSHWVTVNHERKDGVFWLDDGTGRIACDSTGAELDVREFRRRRGNRRKTEWKVLPGGQYYVIGKVKDNPWVGEATSQEGYRDALVGDGEIFMISDKKEKDLRKWYGVSLVASALSTVGLLVGSALI